MNNITITVPENSNVATLVKDGVEKPVTLESVSAIFAKNASYAMEDIPFGCRRIIRSKDKVAYVFIVPKHVGRYNMAYTDNYDDPTRYPIDNKYVVERHEAGTHNEWIGVNIPWPTLVIVSVFSSGGANRLDFYKQYAYATTDDPNTPIGNVRLYKFPYTNVYNDNHVCTGEDIEMSYTIEQVGSTPGILMSGIGNHDLEVGFYKKTGELDITRSYGLIAYLANHPDVTTFPEEFIKCNPLYKVNEIQTNWVG